MIEINRKAAAKGLRLHTPKEGQDGLTFLTFPLLEELSFVRHLFTTRLGGVSAGDLGEANFSLQRGDRKEAVEENFKRAADLLGGGLDAFVFTDQTHTANVRRVSGEDRGKGLIRERDYRDVDGLVTNERGLILSTFHADCTPIFFADPVKRAIGLCHSGWRGTCFRIGKNVIREMEAAYGSNPKDILCGIGPSACGDCYEVGEEVAELFRREFSAKTESFLKEKGEGKYLLDMWIANRLILEEAGILPSHIEITDICTMENPRLLFSHRIHGNRRGNLAAFMVLT